jgi:hypothetical protein
MKKLEGMNRHHMRFKTLTVDLLPVINFQNSTSCEMIKEEPRIESPWAGNRIKKENPFVFSNGGDLLGKRSFCNNSRCAANTHLKPSVSEILKSVSFEKEQRKNIEIVKNKSVLKKFIKNCETFVDREGKE